MFRRFYQDNAAREVGIAQVAEALATESHIVLDVRERYEWDEGHIPGAMHIPLGELPLRVGELPGDRPIYTVCHLGVRSLQAIDILENAGYRGAMSLAGGMDAWEYGDNPVER